MDAEEAIAQQIDELSPPREPGAVIRALAERRLGIVRRQDLIDQGVGRGSIERRLATGSLVQVARGVYSVGHAPLNADARLMAHLQSVGDDAAVSHLSAAGHRGLRPMPVVIDVTSPRRVRRRNGIRTHRAILLSDELTVVRSVPITTPARTALDCASMLSHRSIEKLVTEMLVQGLAELDDFASLVARHRGHRGVRSLRAALERHGFGKGDLKSELEALFQAFLLEHGFPPPATNERLRTGQRVFVVDCLWRRERVAVELDSRFHDHAPAADADTERDRILTVAGWKLLRVRWPHLHEGRRELAADLWALMRPQERSGAPFLHD